MDNRLFFYKARITEVHDGDTLTADVDLGFKLVIKSLKIRLMGIDTAEITSKDPSLKNLAVSARDWLRGQCLGKDVYLESCGVDKYGRSLGRIHLKEGVCLNDQMVLLKLANSYDGGKKDSFVIEQPV